MKKFLVTLLALLTVVVFAFGLSACTKWEGTTMKNWGAVKNNYGFVSETQNYIYLINGIGTSSASNKFGKPVKGALVAVDKNNFENVEVVVPKLFVSADYNSGFYIFGAGEETYVYYGTPCTEKNAQGEIAYSEMTFAKTRLDGTKTTEFFTVSSLTTEFRFVESNGTVYLVYFDETDSAIYQYNTVTGDKITIAETNEETESNVALDTYKFVDGDKLDQAVVVYTLKVYSESYLESKAEQEDYSRATENYNKVVSYKVGDSVNADGTYGKIVLDGNTDKLTYSLTLIDGNIIYIKSTDALSSTKTYGYTIDFASSTEYANESVIVEGALIDGDYAYVIEDSAIIKKDLTSTSTFNDVKVSTVSASKLLFVKDSNIYYLDSDNKIMKVELNNAEANTYLVSNGAIDTNWYQPIVIEINDESILFYADDTTAGNGYISYLNLNTAVDVSEDTNDDEEDDSFYVEGNNFIGIMLEADKANLFIQMMNDIDAAKLDLEVDVLNNYYYQPAVDARDFYEALSDEAKENVGDAYLDKLAEIELAVTLSNKYEKLAGMANYTGLELAEKTNLQKEYEEIKAFRISIIEADEIELADVRDTYIPEKLNNYYQLAQATFETEED